MSECLRILVSDNKLVEPNCEEDKVLGYRYNVNNDSLSLPSRKTDSEADTRRKVLSQYWKIFDPLTLVLPVTMRQNFDGKNFKIRCWMG